MAKSTHLPLNPDQLTDQGGARIDPASATLAGQPAAGPTEDVFDIQINPDFATIDADGLTEWFAGLTRYLRDQGATVNTLQTTEDEYAVPVLPGERSRKPVTATEARYQWRYGDTTPITVVATNASRLDAIRAVGREAFMRRYENSPQLAGTGPDMPNPGRAVTQPPDDAALVAARDHRQGEQLMTDTQGTTNPNQIEDQDGREATEETARMAEIRQQHAPDGTAPTNVPVAVAPDEPAASAEAEDDAAQGKRAQDAASTATSDVPADPDQLTDQGGATPKTTKASTTRKKKK